MAASPQRATVLLQPAPPLWTDVGLFLAGSPNSLRIEAAVALALAARQTVDATARADAIGLLRAGQTALAGSSAGASAEDDRLIAAACAVRQAFDDRPDIVQAMGRVLQAAERDANGTPCATWGELLVLGQYASVPVGRALLAAAGDESERTVARIDRLFQAGFVIDRVCGAKQAALLHGRCNLPLRWIKEAGTSKDGILEDGKARRTVINRMLDGADGLLTTGQESKHETAALCATIALLRCRTKRMIRRLRTIDPYIGRVQPGRIGDAICRLNARFIAWRG
jgi:phytoene/squalene synthetase